MAYPYTPAFVAYSHGAPLEEIAAYFKIPLRSLQAKARQEGWLTLVNKLNVPANPGQPADRDALDRIAANRQRNYETAAKLREHLAGIIAALKNGTLRIKKYFQNKGQIVEYLAEPGPADFLNIATYARTIADMTYRALGDHQSNGGYRADTSAPETPPAPAITIILPEAIAKPRMERSLDSETIDIPPENITGG